MSSEIGGSTPPVGVIDVPDLGVFAHKTVADLQEAHQRLWGSPASGIVLPLFGSAGTTYANGLGAPSHGVRYPPGTGAPVMLPGIAKLCAGEGLEVYLSAATSLRFVQGPGLRVIDIKDDSAGRACFGKRNTQQLLKDFIAEGIERVTEACAPVVTGRHPVAGLAVDICNLWPMGAEGERVELTCFCSSCRAWFKAAGVDLAVFEAFPNPWNLALRDNGTGIGYIEDLTVEMSAEDVLRQSVRKGFDGELRRRRGASENLLKRDAEALLAYMKARDEQVRAALGEVFSGVDRATRRIVITEGSPYGWTSGVFFDKLDDVSVCDEIWFDPTEFDLATSNVTFKSYMWQRSTYSIEAFFRILADAQDSSALVSTGLGRSDSARVRELVELRERQMRSSALASRITLRTLPDSPRRTGFVGVALADEATLLNDIQIPSTITDLQPSARSSQGIPPRLPGQDR